MYRKDSEKWLKHFDFIALDMICLQLIEHIYMYINIVKHILKNKGFVSYALTFVIGLYFFTGITNINFYTILFNPIFVLTYYAVTEQKRK